MYLKVLDGKLAVDQEGNLVKMSNGDIVPEDEPVIVFRARDLYAVPTLYYYLSLHQFDGAEWNRDMVREMIVRFEKFKEEHPDRMKYPGITRGK